MFERYYEKKYMDDVYPLMHKLMKDEGRVITPKDNKYNCEPDLNYGGDIDLMDD